MKERKKGVRRSRISSAYTRPLGGQSGLHKQFPRDETRPSGLRTQHGSIGRHGIAGALADDVLQHTSVPRNVQHPLAQPLIGRLEERKPQASGAAATGSPPGPASRSRPHLARDFASFRGSRAVGAATHGRDPTAPRLVPPGPRPLLRTWQSSRDGGIPFLRREKTLILPLSSTVTRRLAGNKPGSEVHEKHT